MHCSVSNAALLRSLYSEKINRPQLVACVALGFCSHSAAPDQRRSFGSFLETEINNSHYQMCVTASSPGQAHHPHGKTALEIR